jgi:hypothetical protein
MVTRLNRRASPVFALSVMLGAPGEPSLVEYVVNCISQLKGIVLDGTLPIKLTPDAARRLLTPRVSHGFASPDMVRAVAEASGIKSSDTTRIGEGCDPTGR